MPHFSQWPRCNRYSFTIGLMGGSSQTWCRIGSVEPVCTSPPHRRHPSGTQSCTASHSSAGISLRACLVCPFWPPCFRFLPATAFRFGLACGCSLLGGSEEFRGVSFSSFSSSSRIRFSYFSTRASIKARAGSASGGSSRRFGTSDSLIKRTSQITPNRDRAIHRPVNGYYADANQERSLAIIYRLRDQIPFIRDMFLK